MRGEIGLAGPPGRDGVAGLQGHKGNAGAPCSAASDYLTGILLVKHSQSEEIPQCDSGHVKIWDGYSLMYVDGNDYPANQDLGSPGSCVRKFSTMPVMACGQNNVCNYASRNDRTFWLSTSKEIPMMPVSDHEMRAYISRCVVCEVPSNVIAVHSQSLQIPECPYGWEGLWIGYTFLMVSFMNFRNLNSFKNLFFHSTPLSDTVVAVKHFLALDLACRTSAPLLSSSATAAKANVTTTRR